MPYINLSSPDNPLSELDLELLASQEEPPVTVEKYMELNNISFVEPEIDKSGNIKTEVKTEDFTTEGIENQIEEDYQSFQQGVAQPSANAAPTDPNALEISNSELLSEDFSLDSLYQGPGRDPAYVNLDEAQAEYDRVEELYPDKMDRRNRFGMINDDVYHDGYNEREQARLGLEKAKFNLRGSEINVNVPESYQGDYMENIQAAFENVETGFGDIASFQSNKNGTGAENKNILTATLNDGTVLELPMNYDSFFRGSSKQKTTFEENLKKLQDYQLSLVRNVDLIDVATITDPAQVASIVESFDEGDLSLTALNTQLSSVNYQVVPLDQDFEMKQNSDVLGYQLLKDGIIVELESSGIDTIQDYLRTNLSEEETDTMKSSLVDQNNTWVKLQQAKKIEVEKDISIDNNKAVVSQYIKDNTLSKDIPEYLKLLNEKGDVVFSQEEIEHITKYFEKNNSIALDKSQRTKSASERMKTYIDTTNLDLKLNEFVERNVIEFPGLREKLEGALNIKELIKNTLVGANGDGGLRQSMIEKRFDTIHQAAMEDLGEDGQTLIKIGNTLSKSKTSLQNKNLAFEIEKTKLASEALEIIPQLGFEIIQDKIKDIKGVGFNFENIPGQGSFYELKSDLSLSEVDQIKFDEAQALVLNIQNTLQTLQEDKIETINRFKNKVINLKYKEYLDEQDKAEVTKKEIESLTKVVNDETGANYTIKEATEYIDKRDSQEINLYDTLTKEYGTAELMSKDFGDASYSIFLALPTLLGSEWALDEQARLNQKNQAYMTMGELGDGSGNKGLFALRTLSQQFPNILMAIGTGAGAGTFMSNAMVKTTIATAFGVTSGADTYRSLTLQTSLVDQAKNQQDWLRRAYKEGLVDRSTFQNGMADAAQTISFNDLSDVQILSASYMTGIVEGTVTRFIGTAGNTTKFLKDVKGLSSISQTALANQNSVYAKYGLFGLEYTKRVGAELIEESTILIGTQGLSEYAILDRDFNLDQLDDVWFSTLLTAGLSNGPSLAYSAVVNVSLSEDMKQTAKEQYNEIKFLKRSLTNTSLTKSQIKSINNEITDRTKSLGELNGEAAVDASALGADKLKRLLHYKQIKDNLLRQAGVDGSTNPNSVNRIIGQYKRRKLTSDQKKDFENQLNSIDSSINDIRNSDKNYDNVKDMLNDNDPTFGMYSATENRLKENPTDQWKRAKTPRAKIAAVIAFLNDSVQNENTEKAKKDPEIQKEWNDLKKKYTLLGFGLPDSKFKDNWFKGKGKQIGRMTNMATTVTTESSNAADILNEDSLNDLVLVEKPEGSNLLVELERMYKAEEITAIQYQNLKIEIEANKDTNGFIVGNKFIVNTVGDIKERLKSGKIRSGIVILHEINHAQDDRFFGNDGKLSERGRDYAVNLKKSLQNSKNPKLQSVANATNFTLKDLGILEFNEDGSVNETYLDEWTKEAQSFLFAAENDLQLEIEEKSFGTLDNIVDRVFGGERYNINTPEKALAYAVGSNAAARKGQMSEFVKRGIERQKQGIQKNSKTKASKLSSDNKNEKLAVTLKTESSDTFLKDAFVVEMVGKISSRAWSSFGSKIAEGPSRKRYTDQAISELRLIALKWNPAKATFDRYMANTGMQRANSFAKNMGVESIVSKGGTGIKVSLDDKQVQAKIDPTSKSFIERQKQEDKEVLSKLKDSLTFDDKNSLIDILTKGVENEVKYRLPLFDSDSTIKSKSELIKVLTKNLTNARVDDKNLYAKVITSIGGRNNTIDKFEDFLRNNYTTLLQPGGLTTTYLSKAFPQAVQKYVNGMGWVNYDTWKGRTKGTKQGQVDFYRTGDGPYQGSTSGMQKIRRVPNIKNVISLAEFKGKYVDGIKNKVKVAPTEALAKQLTQELGLEIFNEEIQKEVSNVKNTFTERQNLLGAITAVSNFEAQISKEVERPGIKNSLSSLNEAKLELWEDTRFDFYNEILKAKKLDKASVLKIHEAVYGSAFTSKEHKGIATQFSRLLVPVNKADGIVFKTNDEFVNYLEDITLATDINQTIVQFTEADMSIADMNRDLLSIKNARDFIANEFVPYLKKQFPDNALDMLVAYAGTTFSQGQSKFGAFVFKNDKITRHKDSSNRTALFGKLDVDILQNLIQVNFPNVKSIANQTITFNDGTESRKVNINRSADVQQSMLGDNFDSSKSKADAKIAENFTRTLMESLPAKGVDNNLNALIIATINSSSNSALRLSAPVWGKASVMKYKKIKRPRLATAKDVNNEKAKKIGDKMYTKKGNLMMESNYRFEHAVPARVVLWYLYDSYVNKNKSIDLDLLFEDYRVTIIPIIEMDNIITKTGFSSIMLASYKPGDQTWWKRYFNRFTYGKIPYALESYETGDKIGKEFQTYYEEKGPSVFKPNSGEQVLKDNNADEAMKKARSSKYSKKSKKIRVFDFDDTLAKSNSKVLYTMPDGTTGKLSATEFAKDAAKMDKQGVVWDFVEFNKVIEGKKGPLFNVAKTIQDQRGSEDIFVLTARPQEAAVPIQEFLASIGLNIPLQNITGLEDGAAKAKADWMVNKFAEGYNDFYFTDDATKNVKAVKDVLDVLDVKSKVQIARAKFSKNLDKEFNLMLEENKGIDANKRYSQVVAQRLGKNKKRWNFFIPPSADDFRGLTMYMFSGENRKGEADMEWFNKALIKPYTEGINSIEKARQQISNDFGTLVKGFPKITKILRSKITNQQYTYDEAVRVYLWNKAGFQVPGLSKRDQNMLTKIIREDVNLSTFADGVLAVTKKDTYIEPSENWAGGTILSDLNSLTTKINRNEYLAEFIENVDAIFTEDNLRKIEANYGGRVREALVNSIFRMKSGQNKTSGSGDSAIVEKWNNWVNNSIGAIMFFNRKSALLQLISSVNFVNWSDNNPMMAAAAFANQPQYWKDVIKLFNSDKLKQRRSGLKADVNEAEIAAAVKGSKNKMQTAISILLKYGFTPTQIADSLAISTGGATFYRNRINTYKKQGMTDVDAEAKAFEDFSSISDESQQSADPMLISSQQASVLGRLVLAFQNTPMQYTRLMKKAGLDLINGRGDAKTHISKIVYYGFIQNLIFSTLQNALFAMIPGFNEDDEETEEDIAKQLDKKQLRIANGMIDTILRGSGVAGAAISTIKNATLKYFEQEKRGFTADHTYTILELANLSPPIGSKLRKVYSGIQTRKFEKDAIAERGFDVTIDGKFNLSPSYQVTGDIVSGFTNIPLDRLTAEINALTEALDDRNTKWQRIALAIGYRTWDVKAKNEEHDRIKAESKIVRKEQGKIKAKITRKENKRIKDSIYNALPQKEKDSIEFAKIEARINKAFEKLENM